MEMKNVRAFLPLFFCATLVVAAEMALYSVRWVIALSLLGAGLGVIIAPVFEVLHARLRLPRALSALLATAILLLAFGLLCFFFYRLLADELVSVPEKLPLLFDRAAARGASLFRSFPWLERQLMLMRETSYLSGALRGTIQGLRLGTASIVGFLYVNVIAIYLAMDPGAYREGVLSLLPDAYSS